MGRRQLPKTSSRPSKKNLDDDSPKSMTSLGGRHTEQDLDAEALELKAQEQEMSREADRMREIQTEFKCKVKPRFRVDRDLDPIMEDDPGVMQSSSEEEESEEQTSQNRHGSLDTLPYSEQGNPRISPSQNYLSGVSPNSFNREAPPFVFNAVQPRSAKATATTPAQPNIGATPADHMALIQSVLLNQAESNRQMQQLLASSMDKQIDQQATIFARQTLADAKDSMKPMKDGVNICQYFEHFEAELRDAKIPKNKWKRILVRKLSTKAERKSAHLIHNHDASYKILKNHLMKHIGPSSEELCNIVHGAAYSEFKDKKETDKLQHAKYIAERYFLNIDLPDDTVIDHMAIRLYKFHCDRRFAHSLKLSKYHSLEDVLELTASFDSQMDYDKSKSDKAHYSSDKAHYSYKKPYFNKTICNYCRKGGHVEADCYRKQNDTKSDSPRSDKPHHKPKYQDNKRSFNSGTKEHYKDAGVKTRPVTVNWNQTTVINNSIKGQVNGHDADIIIDTGAQITVVPGKFVYHDDLTGDTVSILGVNGDPMPYQTARIPITLREKTVYETVAVAPADQLNTKVLLSTPVNTSMVEHLVDSYLSKQDNTNEDKSEPITVDQAIQINQVTRPKRMAKKTHNYFPDEEESTYEDDRASDTSYDPHSDLNTSYVSEFSDSENDIPRQEEPVQSCAPQSTQTEPSPQSTQTEPSPQSTQTEPSPQSTNTEPSKLEPTSSNMSTPLANDQPAAKTDCQPFEIPIFPVLDKASNSEPFKAATKSDPTLKVVRGLAHHDRNGYFWDKGLLYHASIDPTLGERKRLVVPKPYRTRLMAIAHDKSGHFSNKKTKTILNHHFTWPNMGADIAAHILACIPCKKFNKTAHKQAPFHQRPTISEPYEEIALDLIGPLPRSKHGYTFALTVICMASRWPEVYPLVKSEAENVATALIQFFA